MEIYQEIDEKLLTRLKRDNNLSYKSKYYDFLTHPLPNNNFFGYDTNSIRITSKRQEPYLPRTIKHKARVKHE